jgi:two-component system chemotaxis response regulator CheB
MDKSPYAIAIGASSGGIVALLELVAALPRDFPALMFVVQHVGALPSMLPELLRARGPNHAMHPADGDRPLPGTIYVAPPDHHMLLEHGRIRLFRGPKENHSRPAIDPMFRSVALNYRSRAIGVILTGYLDDGTAGLRAIKDCGGQAIVQDPATATEPAMPQSALDNVEVDLCLPLGEIAPALLRLVAAPAPVASGAATERIRREMGLGERKDHMDNLEAIARPSSLTCPDCGGNLWELNEQQPLRYRCHTGHAFSAQSLEHSQKAVAEYALWSGVRALQEEEILLRRVAAVARANGDHAQAAAGEAQAGRIREQADTLVRMIEEPDSGA